MTNKHTSLEKYTLYSKWLQNVCERVMCERWVGDWTNCNHSYFAFSSTSFSFWAAQPRVLRAHSPMLGAGSLYSILNPTNWLQLTEPICDTRLYNCLSSTCFFWASHLHQFNPSTVKVIPWYLRPVLYNCGGFFLILSFFILYILSFGLVRLRTFGLVQGLVRCTHWVQVFTRARGECDNQRCHNKNSRLEMWQGREWRHARKSGGFWG